MAEQPSRTIDVDAEVVLRYTVSDESAITRCTENHDDQGVPQPDERGGTGWRNLYYPLKTERDVLEHWAYNALANGITDVSRLDGWADLESGVVTVSVEDTYISHVAPPVQKGA